MKILGIDPGSRLTGYGLIETGQGREIRLLAHGTLFLKPENPDDDHEMSQRLLILHQKLTAVIQEFNPTAIAVEKVFFAKNALSALKLGQARGVILLVAAQNRIALSEYNPTEVKRAVSGHGRADKEQLAKIVELMFGKQNFRTSDASDAVALALCHALNMKNKVKSMSSYPRSNKRLSLAQALGLKT